MTNNIRSERVRADMTQEELAAELAVDAATIGRWEKGSTDVPSSKATHMSRLFGCSVDYLFGMTDERKAISTA